MGLRLLIITNIQVVVLVALKYGTTDCSCDFILNLRNYPD